MTNDDTTLGDDLRTAAYEYAKAPRMNVGTIHDRLAEAFEDGAAWQQERDTTALREAREARRVPMPTRDAIRWAERVEGERDRLAAEVNETRKRAERAEADSRRTGRRLSTQAVLEALDGGKEQP